MIGIQHTYTADCDGYHEPGPCPGPVTTAGRNIIMEPRLSDREIDRIAAQVELRLRQRASARGET